MPVRPLPPVRLFLLAAAAAVLSSCGDDKFDQRYRDAEAQIRQEDRELAREMPEATPAGSGTVEASQGLSAPAR